MEIRSIIKEVLLIEAQKKIITGYHASLQPVKNVKRGKMWFSLTIEDALDFHEVFGGHSYKAQIYGKFANLSDVEIIKLFSDNGFDTKKYQTRLIEYQDYGDINTRETRFLKQQGYDGVEHLDEDTAGLNRDIKVLLVFNAKSSVQSFEKIDSPGFEQTGTQDIDDQREARLEDERAWLKKMNAGWGKPGWFDAPPPV